MRSLPIWMMSALVLAASARAAVAAPQIQVTPAIEFYAPPVGTVGGPPGVVQDSGYEVRNTGDAPLVVTGMAITGPDAGIMAFYGAFDPFCGSGQVCAQTFTLAPGESRHFPVSCTPVQAGYFSASASVTSNAAGGTSTVAMSCLGLREPIIQISPSSLDFGIAHWCESFDQACNACPTRPLTQTLVVTNAAAPPSWLDFRITQGLWSDPIYGDFTLDHPCAEPELCSVGAGDSFPIQITFHPRNTVVYDSPLVIATVSPWWQSSAQIPLHAEGAGGLLVFDGPSYLGAVPVGQTLVAGYTVHNAGRSCLSFSGPWSGSAELEVVGGRSSVTLAPGESFTADLACTPSSTTGAGGFADYSLFNEGMSTVSQMVHCGGLASTLAATPAQVAFTGADEVPVGSSSTKRVSVRNVGTLPADLDALAPSDPRFAAALAAGTLPVTLAPGAAVDVDVTFTPTGSGRVTGAITLGASITEDLALDVVGDGVVLAAAVSPAAVDFGTVAHPASPVRQLALHNTGDRPLAVTGVSIDLPGDYAVAGLAAGATIAAGATLGFEVHLGPSLLGQRRGTLAIDLDRAPDVTVPLDALATDPVLEVGTADAVPGDYAVELGEVDVDVGPKTSKVTLHNTGASPISIASCAVDGDAAFGVASACPFTIAGGGTAEVSISFAPVAEAEARATLTLTGTGFATGAVRLPLRGIGLDQHVALSAMAVAFPDTFRHPAEAPVRAVEIRNTGDAELVLSAIGVTGAGFSLVGPASAVLAPGASQEIEVRFAPAAIGEAAGQLVIGNAADPQIARVSLAGRGVGRTVEVGPLAVDLGTVSAGSTVRLGDVLAGAIGIRNVDAAASFAISSAAVEGHPAYRLLGPDRTSLGPGERAVLDLELTAGAAGRYDATISVYLDGDPEPHARIAVTALVVEAPDGPGGPGGGGCGCSTGAPAQGLALGAALLLALRRRGRRRVLSFS